MSTDDYDITIATGYQTPGRRRNNFTATTAPTTGDDSGDFYEVGSVWVDTATDTVYTCVDSTLGAAVWVTGSGGSDPSDDSAAWLPLTTVVSGDPVLVWDGDDSLVPTLVPF